MTIDELKWPWEVDAMDEGRAKGLREGLLEARRQDILMRFGEVTEDVRDQVLGISDEARLRGAHRLAITAGTLQEFLAAL